MAKSFLMSAPDETEVFLLKSEASKMFKAKSLARHALYSRSSTLGDLRTAGLKVVDIRYDAQRGLISVNGYAPRPLPKAKPKVKKEKVAKTEAVKPAAQTETIS